MELPTTLLLAAAIVAFVGYPAAFLYTLTTRARDERMRRALTTFAAAGTTIVALLTIVRALICRSRNCSDCIGSCTAYWIIAIAGFVVAENLLLIEVLRRLQNRGDPE
jgi:cytochrome bd-type quinol oxidase subunit 2